MGIGLFFMGVTSATLQTIGNVESVVRAQRWAAKEYPGQDISALITHVQSWVIVFIGFGEGSGGIIGSFLYELIGFRWQYDIISCCVIAGWVLMVILDSRYEAPVVDEDKPKENTDGHTDA